MRVVPNEGLGGDHVIIAGIMPHSFPIRLQVPKDGAKNSLIRASPTFLTALGTSYVSNVGANGSEDAVLSLHL